MLRKLTKRITNNFGLKLLAAVFAIVLWLVVVNVEDPEKTKGFTIPVTIENADYLSDMGKTYQVLNNSDTITISVTAKRSIISELSESDFSAVANMENISEDLTAVPVTVTASRYASQIEINKRVATLKINVENLETKQYSVTVTTTGTPASNCYVESAVADPEKITVTGPESVLDQIASVQAVVDVSQASEDIATNSTVTLLDEDGETIAQDRLTLNRSVVAVDVSISMGKTVPLKITTNGNPADGYRFTEGSCSVSEVKLTGSPDILGAISEIEISGSQMNIAGAVADQTVSVDLTKFLPEGVSLASGQSKTVTVTLKIEGQTTKTFAVPVKNITVENLPSNLSLTFQTEYVDIVLEGYADELEEIKAEDITGTINAANFSADTVSAPIVVNGSYTAQGTTNASVTVAEKSTEVTEGSADDNADDNTDETQDALSE